MISNKSIICRLIFECDDSLSEKQIQSYIYLLDRRQQENDQFSFSTYMFVKYYNGPHAKQVSEDITALVEEDYLYEESNGYSIDFRSKVESYLDEYGKDELAETIRVLLTDVRPSEICAYVNELEEIQSATKYTPIDAEQS